MSRRRKVAFAGKTEAGRDLILYVEAAEDETNFVVVHTRNPFLDRDRYFLQVDDGEVWELPPQTKLFMWENDDDPNQFQHLKIQNSGVWNGSATRSKQDLIEAIDKDE